MGAWGSGLYDNDTAMDCVLDYEEYLKQGYSIENAIEKLKHTWYIKDNWSILVIADLQIKNLKRIDKDLGLILKNTIDEELTLINEWKEPFKRKEIIIEFYNGLKHLIE